MPVVSPVSAIDTVAWAEEERRNKHVGELQPRHPILKYVPRMFKFDRSPLEASGLAVDIYGRATIGMSALFLGPSLLQLASNQAQDECLESLADDLDACMADAKVYGFKPSSLLSNIATVSGLLGALILPPFGAIVDHTPYRRDIGLVSAFLLVVIKGIEISISSKTWFYIACLQILVAVLYNIHLASIYAYKSELSDYPEEQTKYNTYFYVIMYFSTLVFMAEVLAISYAVGSSDIGTARISLILTIVTCGLSWGFAWIYLFRDRPPLSFVEDGRYVICSGFHKLFATSVRIQKRMPSLRWFMWSLLFSESANSALITVATTYMSHFLQMDAKEIGTVFLMVLLMGIPGSKIGEFVALRANPLISARICSFAYIIVTASAAIALRSPNHAQYTIIFGGLWGMCLGWLHPMHTTIFVTLRPSGQDAELMSMYLFCCTAFSWLPPLVFTIINEHGIHISWGLQSLNIFFLLGLLCTVGVGNYDHAISKARSLKRPEGADHDMSFAKDHLRTERLYADLGGSDRSVDDDVELRPIT